jgi:hypothetical protein
LLAVVGNRVDGVLLRELVVFVQSCIEDVVSFFFGNCRQRPVFMTAADFEAASCPRGRNEI